MVPSRHTALFFLAIPYRIILEIHCKGWVCNIPFAFVVFNPSHTTSRTRPIALVSERNIKKTTHQALQEQNHLGYISTSDVPRQSTLNIPYKYIANLYIARKIRISKKLLLFLLLFSSSSSPPLLFFDEDKKSEMGATDAPKCWVREVGGGKRRGEEGDEDLPDTEKKGIITENNKSMGNKRGEERKKINWEVWYAVNSIRGKYPSPPLSLFHSFNPLPRCRSFSSSSFPSPLPYHPLVFSLPTPPPFAVPFVLTSPSPSALPSPSPQSHVRLNV